MDLSREIIPVNGCYIILNGKDKRILKIDFIKIYFEYLKKEGLTSFWKIYEGIYKVLNFIVIQL